MTNHSFDWQAFYQNVSGRQPRELLIDVVGHFENDGSTGFRQAIDLGCGDGTETAYLLAHGWRVLAIDSEPIAFTHLHTKIPAEAQGRLQTQVASFEAVTLTPADLIHAGFSLPFCHPHHFSTLWDNVVSHISRGGRFAGQLFGVRDTWASNPDMTFFTAEQAQAMFTGFDVERFDEEDEDGRSTVGAKHWHIFHVIARKR